MPPVHQIIFKLLLSLRSFLLNRIKLVTIIVMIANIILFASLQNRHDNEWIILSGLGGKCLDIENKDFFNGARLIVYQCYYDKDSQKFSIVYNKIMLENQCLDIQRDEKNQRDFLAMRTCRDVASQEWKYHNHNHTITNANGKCIDLLGGADYFYQHQITTVWDCNLSNNQKWYLSKYVSKNNLNIASEKIVTTGRLGEIQASDHVIANASGDLNFTQGFKDGYLLKDRESSVIETDSDYYLVPAGIVEDFFNKPAPQ